MSARTRTHPPTPGGPAGWAGLEPRLTPEELAEANRPLTPEELAAVPVLEEVDEVPTFATTAEADAWWDTHQPSGAAIARWRAVPGNAAVVEARLAALRERQGKGTQAARASTPPKQPAPVSLRLEADTLRRLRALAELKGTRYQSLLKQFVVERLYEEEKRERLVG